MAAGQTEPMVENPCLTPSFNLEEGAPPPLKRYWGTRTANLLLAILLVPVALFGAMYVFLPDPDTGDRLPAAFLPIFLVPTFALSAYAIGFLAMLRQTRLLLGWSLLLNLGQTMQCLVVGYVLVISSPSPSWPTGAGVLLCLLLAIRNIYLASALRSHTPTTNTHE